MPRLIFKKGKVEYYIPHGIIKKLVELGKESRVSGLEKGTELCGKPKKEGPTEITGIGRVCTGDSCSIEVKDCGSAPSIGDFHTHPYAEDYSGWEPQKASFGDLLYLLWRAKYSAWPGLGCRIGVTPTGLSSIECDKVKKIPSDEEMQALEDKYDEYRWRLGETVIKKSKYFYPSRKIQIDGKIEDKYEYNLNLNSPLFKEYSEGELVWMNTNYFLRKVADREVIESIKSKESRLIEDIKDKIKKNAKLDPLLMVVVGLSFSQYLDAYAPPKVKKKIKAIEAAKQKVEEELGKSKADINGEIELSSTIAEIIQSLDTTVTHINIKKDIIYMVFDYEGVSRALAAKDLGITRVPVIEVVLV